MQRFSQRQLQMTKFLGVGRLLMRRNWVMDGRVDATVEQALLEGRAIRYADDEEVPYVRILAGADGWEAHGGVLELATITLGDFSAAGVVGVDVRLLHAEQSRLKFVEAVVGALDEVFVFLVRAVVTKRADDVG